MKQQTYSQTREGYLDGQLLLAMPTMSDPRFERSVIFMCSHSAEGGMGLIVNSLLDDLSFAHLLEQLDITIDGPVNDIPIHAGGPVETGRGFVLHSADYVQDSTLVVSQSMALTATVDILKAIASGKGPADTMLALGYACWAPGQLEREIQANAWLNVNADKELIFNTPPEDKWPRALHMLGIDLSALSGQAGHA